MALACKKCPYVVAVAPGEKAPPWCPRCGSDLKPADTSPAKPNATQPASAWDSATPAGAVHEAKAPSSAVDKALAELPSTAVPANTPELPLSTEIPAPAVVQDEVFGANVLWQVVAVITLLACLGIVGVALSQLVQPRPGKPIQAGVYGVIGLFGVGALIAAYITFRLFGQKYAVSSDGLTVWHHFKATHHRWEHIREVYKDVHPSWMKYRLVVRGGQDLSIAGEVWRYKKLGELIAAKVAEHSLPAALAELEAGRDVRFGPLAVSRAGVTIKGQLEPWHRIGVISYGLNPNPKLGTAVVSNMYHARIGSAWVELGDIPNCRLFEEVAARLFPSAVATNV